MTNDTSNVLIAIIGGGYLVGLAALMTAIFSRRKTKAEALQIIETSAGAQVLRMKQEAENWRSECLDLRVKVTALECRMEANDSCQGEMTRKLVTLEREKMELIAEVGRLKKRIEGLEAENVRLKG